MYLKVMREPTDPTLIKLLKLMVYFYKACDKIDKNLICDMNELLKKMITTVVMRQLKRIG